MIIKLFFWKTEIFRVYSSCAGCDSIHQSERDIRIYAKAGLWERIWYGGMRLYIGSSAIWGVPILMDFLDYRCLRPAEGYHYGECEIVSYLDFVKAPQMHHIAIYRIYSSRISTDISAHIGPKWYPIKFCTYPIISDKISISRPIYRYIGRDLKQW